MIGSLDVPCVELPLLRRRSPQNNSLPSTPPIRRTYGRSPLPDNLPVIQTVQSLPPITPPVRRTYGRSSVATLGPNPGTVANEASVRTGFQQGDSNT